MNENHRENAILFLQQMSKVTLALKGFMRQKFKAHNLDITFEMLQVLRFLWAKDNVNQQEIANAIIKDKASLTYLIDNLVRRKLVQRTEDGQDRRNKLITLTPEGRNLQSLVTPWLEEMYGLVAKNISEETLENGLRIFDSIYKSVQETAE
ncbi:MarR family transcriptional regulator [Rufibacter immobilis]|uniref:MarR family transcriptional regulator n=1 Tax=Rufibacter immobilis TaxID=1348778 RepID=A0A3M9N2C8_9BACT|nr:MarR family transcriptional regulator [Rufibacter immobilis]RNI31940.1 MarR family transcriptional regulator [Rufibacter immobilis]